MRIAVAGTVLLLAACTADLGRPSLVDEPRVLALRVAPADAPEVAWPAPGDTVTLDWLLVDAAEPAHPVSWALAACTADPSLIGGSICDAPPFALVTGEEPSGELLLPEAAALAGRDRVLLRGVVCASGAPILEGEPPATSCDEGTVHARRVRLELRLSPRDGANHHPALAAVRLAGEPWTAAVDAGCEAGAPRVAAGGPALPVRTEAPPEALEPFVPPGGEPAREQLQLAHHATAGRFESYFAILDEAAAEVRWTPPGPEEVPPAGLPVRFWITALDMRGGTAWLARSLCVTP